MSYHETIYVAFGASQIAVTSDCQVLLGRIMRHFREMLAPEPTATVGVIDARRYGDAYELRTNGLQTAPAGTLEDSVQLARDEITNHLIAAHPELFWLHAGAAALEAGAVLVVGTWGHGKSTMVTSLCSRGWSYLSDDVVALDPKARLAIPFHQTPLVREDPGHDLPRERILELYKTEIDLGRVSICRRPVPIAAVLLPTFARHAPAQLLRISPAAAALELLQSCMNFGQHRAAGVDFVCEFVESVPAFRLTFGSGEAAAELVSEAHACGYSI